MSAAAASKQSQQNAQGSLPLAMTKIPQKDAGSQQGQTSTSIIIQTECKVHRNLEYNRSIDMQSVLMSY